MSKPFKEKNIQLPLESIKNLLTSSEWRMLKNRFLIANLLEEGLSIRKIAEKVKVGTDTVVRVSKLMAKQSSVKKIKSPTSWVFGKSDE